MNALPEEYRNVKLNVFQESACSPEVKSEDFRGILIKAPPVVEIVEAPEHPSPLYRPDAADGFPICGMHQFSNEFIHELDYLQHELVVVAVDANTHQAYASTLHRGHGDVYPLPREERDFSANTFVTDYFTVDLYTHIPELPRVETTYHIFALLGEAHSNVVDVQLEPRCGAAARDQRR